MEKSGSLLRMSGSRLSWQMVPSAPPLPTTEAGSAIKSHPQEGNGEIVFGDTGGLEEESEVVLKEEIIGEEEGFQLERLDEDELELGVEVEEGTFRMTVNVPVTNIGQTDQIETPEQVVVKQEIVHEEN